MTTITDFDTVAALAQRTVVDPRYPINTYALDLIWVLYDRVLRVDPDNPGDPDRDRFLLSKGHGPGSYYAVLAAKGFFPTDWLDDVAAAESPLGAHPDVTRVPGVEVSAGSLGHGLPLGIGIARGLLAQRRAKPRVYVLVGDAEFDEGSNHEALAYAGATGLPNLTVVVANNGSASHGWPGGIASRFTAQGWTAQTVPMTDHDALAAALTAHTETAPHAVVASTVEA